VALDAQRPALVEPAPRDARKSRSSERRSANSSSFSRMPRAHCSSRPPTTISVRDATVGRCRAPRSVSGVSNATNARGHAQRLGHQLQNTVTVPWPISVFALRMRGRPSGVRSSAARDASFTSPLPVKPAPW
jgi:hypothetical protein